MFRNYFLIAYRNLVNNKLYGVLNIAGLALGLTCGILIFAIVKFNLSFDDFHHDKDRIYRLVTEQHRDDISRVYSVPPALAKSFRTDYDLADYCSRIATFNDVLVNVTEGDAKKKFVESNGIAFVEEGFFKIFNFPMLMGNPGTALSQPNTVIITQRLARKYFGSADPLGKIINLDNSIDCKVTGVLKDLPKNSDFNCDIYFSYATLDKYNEWFNQDDAWGGISSALQAYMLLKPGVDTKRVEDLLTAYARKYRKDSHNQHYYKLQPLSTVHSDTRYGGTMDMKNIWIISFVALFLVIAACVNFINLATAQAVSRSKEVGIRKALGSFRSQLFWQFIMETALITFIAIFLSILVAYAVLPSVNRWLDIDIPYAALNYWQLWVFIPVMGILITFIAGSYPALILSGFNPVKALKGRLFAQAGSFSLRRLLIIVQYSISIVLIIGMIIVTRQMNYSRNGDLGFHKDAIVIVPMGAGAQNDRVTTFKQQLSQMPGVKSYSLCYTAPASQTAWNTSIRFDKKAEEEPFSVDFKAGDEQYLKTFGLELLAGRNLFASDTVREVLVNEQVVKKLQLSSPADAIGHLLNVADFEYPATIVGVLKDFHDRSFHSEIQPLVLTTYSGNYRRVAIKLEAKSMVPTMAAIEEAWIKLYPEQMYKYDFLDAQIAQFYESEQMMLNLVRIFTIIAIFIGCLGLYGLVAFMVSQKRKEIGIRKVLGSSIPQVIWIFGKEFSRLILIAFLVAAPIAWYMMSNWLAGFEYHVDINAATYFYSIFFIVVIASITVGYHTLRAAWMNPAKILRE